jgi:hypothetical protein
MDDERGRPVAALSTSGYLSVCQRTNAWEIAMLSDAME